MFGARSGLSATTGPRDTDEAIPFWTGGPEIFNFKVHNKFSLMCKMWMSFDLVSVGSSVDLTGAASPNTLRRLND
jgi:hypothetical protein